MVIGTTLTALLTYQFVNRLFQESVKTPVNDLLDYTKESIDSVISKILEQSKKVETYDDIYRIALTSSKSERIAELIKSVYTKTGFNANIAVELSEHFNNTYTEVTEGLTFDSGLLSSKFSNMDNGNCSFEKPVIEIINESITDVPFYSKMIDQYHIQETPLILIAPSFSDSFIKWVITMKEQRGLRICLIKTPGWGFSVEENIKDLKTFLNGNTANKIVVDPYSFTVYNNPDKKKIRNRIKQLDAKLEVETEDFTINDYKKRISNLQQTSAIIYVGSTSKKGAEEELDRIEDAVGACKSALHSGYVSGQGIALKSIDGYEEWFNDIIHSPYYTILYNANLNPPSELVPYNVRTRQYDSNLTDPSLVIISALKNSFALAELLINTSYTLHD